jgi:hypothetical protein
VKWRELKRLLDVKRFREVKVTREMEWVYKRMW